MFIDTDVMDEETTQRIQDLGHITIEKEAYEKLVEAGATFNQLVVSHVRGDYGKIDPMEAWANDLAMYQRAGKCRSVYTLDNGCRIEVLTEWNQPITTIRMEVIDESTDDHRDDAMVG